MDAIKEVSALHNTKKAAVASYTSSNNPLAVCQTVLLPSPVKRISLQVVTAESYQVMIHCRIVTTGYHFTFLKTHIMFYISNLNFGSISCLLLEVQNEICEMAKCDMRITFHVTQMPNVICEKNMKHEFNFSKNVPLM